MNASARVTNLETFKRALEIRLATRALPHFVNLELISLLQDQ